MTLSTYLSLKHQRFLPLQLSIVLREQVRRQIDADPETKDPDTLRRLMSAADAADRQLDALSMSLSMTWAFDQAPSVDEATVEVVCR